VWITTQAQPTYGFAHTNAGTRTGVYANGSYRIYSEANTGAAIAKPVAFGDAVSYNASADQSITGVGDTLISTGAVFNKFTSDAVRTLTATPIMAAGLDGALRALENVGTNTLTLSDESTVPGSNISSRDGANLVIAADEIVWFMYSTDLGAWRQLA